MDFLKSFKERLFSITSLNFEQMALELYEFQVRNNPIYAKYINTLGIDGKQVKNLENIPFLPIDFFKKHKIVTGSWTSDCVFESSGTTGQITSRHYIEDLGFFHHVTKSTFQQFYGNLSDFHILALLPSYLERKNASLVAMADHFIKESKSEYSGFYLDDLEGLVKQVIRLKNSGRKTLLLGVTFALLDLAENYTPDLEGAIVMETGGMKGKRKEIIREELYEKLTRAFGSKHIHSEYGMTELTSQAYSWGAGRYFCPQWMQVTLRDINDPFCIVRTTGKSGGINIVDLANISTCAFIETKDIGIVHDDRSFSVLGRFDNTDVRGCNLMIGP